MTIRSFRPIVLATAILQLLIVEVAWGQLAPTGPHNAGRPTDTGFSSVSGTGDYSTAVSLDLPPARGGLPVPLAVVHGGHGVGAAGLGWDIPLSFVRRDTTIAHRRPAFLRDAPIAPREQVTLSLVGRTLLMVKDGDVWRARQDAPDVLLYQRDDDTWQAYDGNGNEFTFISREGLGDDGLWVLSSARSTVQQNRVDLQYDVSVRSGTGWHGLTLDLISIRYDTSPDVSQCTKTEIDLDYGTLSTLPLSVTFLDDLPIVRMRTLSSISIRQRATCGSSAETVRSYLFSYEADRDTGLPRLAAVQMGGRESSAEATTLLPNGNYGYGSATSGGAGEPIQLQYVRGTDIPIPADLTGTPPIASSDVDSTLTSPVGGKTYAMWQDLIDITGDGRADLVYRKDAQLWVAINRPAGSSIGGSASSLTATAPMQLSSAPFTGKPLSSHSSSGTRYDYAWTNEENVWRQTIDINGDGRLDVIDASESPDTWYAYLNTPGNPATWVKRAIYVRDVREALEAKGHVFANSYVPLARRTSGRDTIQSECYHWDDNANPPSYQRYETGCTQTTPKQVVDGALEKTFTEWELKDVNGDGYPDFVFNSTPVSGRYSPPEIKSSEYLYVTPVRVLMPGFGDDIHALINVAGVRFDDLAIFSSPVQIYADGDPGCGVSEWIDTEVPGALIVHEQVMQCGIEDVNGDGLADRIEAKTVLLGTGKSLEASGFTLTLPDFIRHANPRDVTCIQNPAHDPYNPVQRTALRDLTGDGRPDFIAWEGSGWQVSIGTGTGFNSPLPIKMPDPSHGFAISTLYEKCYEDFSNTLGGLYDIDGDGKPEIVYMLHDPSHLEVYHLSGSELGNPDAGRLTRISNGYGAETSIHYRSAKQDAINGHQVPFPEIVVTAVDTIGENGLGGNLTTVGYAYGDAQFAFDPVADAFLMIGYGKSIEVRGTGPREGLAETGIVTERYPLLPYVQNASDQEKFARYQKAGRVRDVYQLGYDVPGDPWRALASVFPSDGRRIRGEHTEWESHYTPLAAPADPSSLDCFDVPFPYDWTASLLSNTGMPCSARGFTYVRTQERWEGTQAPPSTSNVQTRSEVLTVDDYGNVLSAKNENDLFRNDDDVCTETTYAQPTSTIRILHAPATRRLTDCEVPYRAKILAQDRWEYDTLPVGSVSVGRTTAHVYEKRTTDLGTLVGTVREYEASYDAIGNPVFFASAREDGTLRTTEVVYDTFGVAAVQVTHDGSDVDPLVTTIGRDPVTLDTLTSQESGGPVWSRAIDGFGRETSTGVVPVGGDYGVVSITDYLGFAGQDPLGRRVHRVSLDTPTLPTAVATARRHEATVFLDELGRTRRSEQNLGADYGDATMVTSLLTYDGLGRVVFSADAFPLSQSEVTAYGTSYKYMSDGTIRCAVRGNGPHPGAQSSDLASELFPTCVTRTFVNNQARTEVQRPDALLAGSPQAGVNSVSYSSAIGWVLSTETDQGTTRLEFDQRTYDRLGQLTSLTRSGTSGLAKWSWRLDNLGEQLSVSEPSVSRYFAYTNFGELVATTWTDLGTAKSVQSDYDAFSRKTGSTELSSGAAVSGTSYHWTYDPATGHLASTDSELGSIALSYDNLGTPETRTYTNHRSGAQYVETTSLNLFGQLNRLQFQLPDGGGAAETFEYNYDSAGRLREIYAKTNGVYSSKTLYKASLIDVFGRVLEADYGEFSESRARYQDTGRRLPISVSVNASGVVREIRYGMFDPVGREIERTERQPGSAIIVRTTNSYNATGSLGQVVVDNGSISTTSFTYDDLGNRRATTGAESTAISVDGQDPDRMCRINYGAGWGFQWSCNVLYNNGGSITQMPVPGSGTAYGTRTLSFYPSGLVQTVSVTGAPSGGNGSAAFSYDGTGEISEITSTVGIAVDRRFGLIQERSTSSPTTLVLVRNIPGPNGVIATAAGNTGEWVYQFAEQRGTRFTANDQAGFVQDVSYSPFGIASSSGASTSDPKYTRNQWNGGTALESFGLVQLGARLYDPRLGRFLSRDPLMIPRSASKTNPYAFAMNDPVNSSDPSGLDCDAWGGTCQDSDVVVKGFASVGGEIWDTVHGLFGDSKPTVVSPQVATSVVGHSAWKTSSVAVVAGGLFVADALSALASPPLPSNLMYPEEGLISEKLYILYPDELASDLAKGAIEGIVCTLGCNNAWAPGPNTRTYPNPSTWQEAKGIGLTLALAGIIKYAPRGGGRLALGEAGAYGELKARGVPFDGITPHHMPQAAQGFTPRAQGGALAIEQDLEHTATRTFGGKGAVTARAERGLPFRQVLARDIWDIKGITGTKYNAGIIDLLEYYRVNFPELMAR